MRREELKKKREPLDIKSLLDHIIPFRFLQGEEKRQISEKALRFEAEPLDWIYQKDEQGKDLFLLEEGQVEMILQSSAQVNPEKVIRSGHYFGERESILQLPRQTSVRALTPLVYYQIPEKDFLEVLKQNKFFAQAFGTILRDKHGIFRAFDHFIGEVKRGESQNYLPLRSLISAYQDLEPALHPGARGSEIDFGALSYGVRRLPANLLRTLVWFLTDEVPASYRVNHGQFPSVESKARRRDIWEMAQGKNLVLLRNGLSDPLDLISCLCLFSVEAKKIRHKLQRPGVMEALVHYLDQKDLPSEDQSITLPFTSQEWTNIKKIWPQETVERLREISLHHEDFYLNFQRQWSNYNSRRSEKWTLGLSKGTMEFLGLDPGELGEEWEVHIISSNTHSITNLLNPHWVEIQGEIEQWLRNQDEDLFQQPWADPMDRIYGALPLFLKDNPQHLPTDQFLRSQGIYNLGNTASTGIAVQLICPHLHPQGGWDPALPPFDARRKVLIVNIDYAFGQQAEEIIRNLLLLFHQRIKSINILGKAGALQGKRGDILIPRGFVEQVSDKYWKVDPLGKELLGALEGRFPQGTIHEGVLLTVAGTLLQNTSMLHYYKNIWGGVGLEMEGSFYHSQIKRFQEQGLIDPDLPLRYFYYVSDLPLGHGPDLSLPMSPFEGVPPLYAVSRMILEQIFTKALV